MEPLVSVICCTYNRPDLLKKALVSVNNQTSKDFEIIVINDGGVEVQDIINSELTNVPCQYFSFPTNRGLAYSIDYAISKSNGEYLMFIDDDNEFLPEHIFLLLKNAIEKKAVLTYSDSLWRYYKNYEIIHEGIWEWDYSYNTLNFLNYIDPVQVILRKEVVLLMGGFDHNLKVSDWDLWLRLRSKGDFYHLPIVTCIYGFYDHVRRLSGSNSNFTVDVIRMKEKYLSSGDSGLVITANCLQHTFLKEISDFSLNNYDLTNISALSICYLEAMALHYRGSNDEAFKILLDIYFESAKEDPVFKLFVSQFLITNFPNNKSNVHLEKLLLEQNIHASPLFVNFAKRYLGDNQNIFKKFYFTILELLHGNFYMKSKILAYQFICRDPNDPIKKGGQYFPQILTIIDKIISH